MTDVDGIANSVDTDQTALNGGAGGAVFSTSTLFAQACVSENLGSFK